MTTQKPPSGRPRRGPSSGPSRGPGKGKPKFGGGNGRPGKAPPRKSAPRPAVVRDDTGDEARGERIAKVMARAGLCSRRDAEVWISQGRVELNGKVLETPAVTVTVDDRVLVDGNPLPTRERTRLWLYHKPRGLVTTNRDPEGRPTVFSRLPDELPRVLAVGRLDINTEGLLLLTNDGGLARVLELPATGWLRRYRVRAFGKITQADLDKLADGVAVDGVLYGAIEATLDKEQGDNVWLTVGLREGKNREVKRVLEHLGLTVNRLIRLSFGPFQLMDLEEGAVREIRGRVLRDQLGEKLTEEAGCDFDAPIFHAPEAETKKPSTSRGGQRPGQNGPRGQGHWVSEREAKAEYGRKKPSGDRGAKKGPRPFRDTPFDREDRPARPNRKIWGEEGLLEDKQQESRNARKERPAADHGARSERQGRPSRPDRPDRPSRPDRPDRPGRGPRPGGDRRDGPGSGRKGRP